MTQSVTVILEDGRLWAGIVPVTWDFSGKVSGVSVSGKENNIDPHGVSPSAVEWLVEYVHEN